MNFAEFDRGSASIEAIGKFSLLTGAEIKQPRCLQMTHIPLVPRQERTPPRRGALTLGPRGLTEGQANSPLRSPAQGVSEALLSLQGRRPGQPYPAPTIGRSSGGQWGAEYRNRRGISGGEDPPHPTTFPQVNIQSKCPASDRGFVPQVSCDLWP